jgi:hypothetical protein
MRNGVKSWIWCCENVKRKVKSKARKEVIEEREREDKEEEEKT